MLFLGTSNLLSAFDLLAKVDMGFWGIGYCEERKERISNFLLSF